MKTRSYNHSPEAINSTFYFKDGMVYWKKPLQKRHLGVRAGFKNNNGYRSIYFEGLAYAEHRIVWCLVYGEYPKNQIDHINGVRDDNRIENLRVVSARDNAGNRKKNRDGKLVGAYFHKKDNRWHSQIKINGKSTYISSHKTELEAHKKYLKVKEQLENEAKNES